MQMLLQAIGLSICLSWHTSLYMPSIFPSNIIYNKCFLMPINIDESSSNVIALQYLLNIVGWYVTHWAEKQLYYTTNGNKKKYSLNPVFLPMKPGFTNIEFKINSLKKKVKFHSFHTWISCHTPTIADNLLACLQIITFFNQHCEVSDIFYKTESAWIRRCTLTSKVSIEINDHKFRN